MEEGKEYNLAGRREGLAIPNKQDDLTKAERGKGKKHSRKSKWCILVKLYI